MPAEDKHKLMKENKSTCITSTAEAYNNILCSHEVDCGQ